MFRDMRLGERLRPMEEAVRILKDNTHGVLALDGDAGYTYAVPVNFAYSDNKIYFHGASSGHKYDAMKNNNKISFCVVEREEILAKDYNTAFMSAIAFGTVRILEDEKERNDAFEIILKKFSPEFMEGGREYVKAEWENVAAFEITIEHLTAKEGY